MSLFTKPKANKKSKMPKHIKEAMDNPIKWVETFIKNS